MRALPLVLFLLALGALAPAAHAQDYLLARLVADHSGKCLSVVGQSTGNGAAFIQRACTGTADQTFRLNAEADGLHFTLRPLHSNSCADVAEAAPSDGGLIQQWACGPGPNQLWAMDILENTPARKVVTFRASHSGRCLSVVSGSLDDGAGVAQFTCGEGPYFRWRLELVQ